MQNEIEQCSNAVHRRSFTRRRLTLIFGVCGFAVGCVFWQIFGISNVAGPMAAGSKVIADRVSSMPARAPDTMQSSSAGLLSVTMTAGNCTAFVLDRDSGQAVRDVCPASILPLRSLRAARKEDRRMPLAEAKAGPPVPAHVPAVASWSATVRASR
jgi:hypothetical protein